MAAALVREREPEFETRARTLLSVSPKRLGLREKSLLRLATGILKIPVNAPFDGPYSAEFQDIAIKSAQRVREEKPAIGKTCHAHGDDHPCRLAPERRFPALVIHLECKVLS